MRCGNVVMQAQEEKEGDEEKKKVEGPLSLKDQKPELTQSLYGIVVFLITLAFFSVGLFATLARGFLPSGLAPPV